MSRSADLPIRERLRALVDADPVVLFMKGDREQPQCGFSATVVGLLDRLLAEYATVDVLGDPEVREGVKEFSDWPTIPQLYVRGEFVGGCDIVREMYESGELYEVLGLSRDAAPAPHIEITQAAAALLQRERARAPSGALHLGIDARFRYSLGFGPASPDQLIVESAGFRVAIDADSARRADGLVLDVTETPSGPRLAIRNPNEPAPASQPRA
jgi:monothiol glutaredoxin